MLQCLALPLAAVLRPLPASVYVPTCLSSTPLACLTHEVLLALQMSAKPPPKTTAQVRRSPLPCVCLYTGICLDHKAVSSMEARVSLPFTFTSISQRKRIRKEGRGQATHVNTAQS